MGCSPEGGALFFQTQLSLSHNPVLWGQASAGAASVFLLSRPGGSTTIPSCPPAPSVQAPPQ